MRLFVAIPLSQSIVEKLIALREPIRGVRWQDPEQLHLTLRFIGSVDSFMKTALQESFSQIHVDQFQFNIKGVGFFPNANNPRVYWAGVSEEPEMMALQERVEKACKNAGVEAETRTFVPHITLAKVKGRSEALSSYVRQHQHFEIDAVSVKKFNLYRSELTRDGAVHTVVQTYPLN